MKVLHLTLKKKWFDMIASGEKKEEYREIKEYWIKRLAVCNGETPIPHGYYCKKANCISCITRGDGFKPIHFDYICFRNGYAVNAPKITVECLGISIGSARPE